MQMKVPAVQRAIRAILNVKFPIHAEAMRRLLCILYSTAEPGTGALVNKDYGYEVLAMNPHRLRLRHRKYQPNRRQLG